MRSKMDPRYYLSEEAFLREQALLYERVWQFLALKPLVSRHNAFVTRRLCGIPIVVQNFHGEIHAFENVCLHRQAALQWDSEGRRPLVCRYHGWGYNARGEAENIPFCEDVYRFPEARRRELRLREYPLEIVGNLIFVNLAPDPIPIGEQFTAEFIESLRSSSEAYDDEVMLTTFHARFNWKLAYENLRDANHPRFVHSQSLAKAVTFAPAVDDALSAEAKTAATSNATLGRDAAMALMRRFSWGGPDSRLHESPRYEWHRHVERWGNEDWYYNWLAFPNLHIASATAGFSFIVEHHVPVAPGRTDLLVHWVTAKKKTRYAWSPAVLYSHMLGARIVLAEDIKVMEMVQSALHQRAPTPTAGDYEAMNMLVERWYLELMGGSFAI